MNIIRWIEHHTFWPPKIIWKDGFGLDIRITPTLWLEGRYNEIRHKYMMWRKKKGLNYKDYWFKALPPTLDNK